MNHTVIKGNELRDNVFKLLVAAGKEGVSTEKNIGGKNSDVFYLEKDVLPGPRKKIVAECKNYKKSLSRSDYDKIYNTYNTVKTQFDYLIIVTTNGLAPGVRESLELTDWVKHLTFFEFCHFLLGFSRYVESLKVGFNQHGLSSYYVPLNSVEGGDIEEEISEWIESPAKRPLAVLAGYGMGKTSLAKRIAYKYASTSRTDSLSRIPMYIELGGIYAEQDIQGLICKHCTTRNPVENFNYDLFLEFNRQGLLLLILDGFDEMKHAMSYSDFLFNFNEINTLVEGNSKVLVLGRPSAFMSENEKLMVLHGHEKIEGRAIVDASKRDYIEMEVAFFSREQLKLFVKDYFQYQKTQGFEIGGKPIDDSFISSRTKEILDSKFSKLIERPVHARMLITISLSTSEKLSVFSRFALYKKFLQQFLEREMSKHSRKKTSIEDRFSFLQKVAWEAWVVNDGKSISISAMSGILNDTNLEQILRELLTGSVLEPKGDDNFYFVHRSFQEYLAAEYLLKTNWTSSSLSVLDKNVNLEILRFLSESGKSGDFAKSLINDAMTTYEGTLSFRLLEFLSAEYSNELENLELEYIIKSAGPWEVVLAIMNITLDERYEELQWLSVFLDLKTDERQLALLLGLILAHRRTGRMKETLSSLVCVFLHYKCRDWIKHTCKNRKASKALKSLKERKWALILSESIQVARDTEENIFLKLSIDALGYSLLRNMGPEYDVRDAGKFVHSDQLLSLNNVVIDLKGMANDTKNMNIGELKMFWRSTPKIENLVTIQDTLPAKEYKKISLKKSSDH